MPLTALQKVVLAVLAGNRSEESHFAGGVVLNIMEDSARFSHDFDIFHELAQEVSRASERDVKNLREAGFEVETLARGDEWERESTFRKPDLPIGVAFVDAEGRPGWIGHDPALRVHAPSVRGCWPTVRGLS